jgi:hypothetical protein
MDAVIWKLSSILVVTLLLATTNLVAGLLLSDLPTPSLVLDVQSIQRQIGTEALPPLVLRQHNAVLMPMNPVGGLQVDTDKAPIDVLGDNYRPLSYLHCKVTRGREEADPVLDDPTSSFLAEIDLKPSLYDKAKLVLGLNNHHVGSYYWARAAGAGAAMEAPGILFDTSNPERGALRWDSNDGPTDCNSNDGKRSEWVNFLRKSDTVQLLPENAEIAVHRFAQEAMVYGISSKGRPMGSEPEVVCTWKLV